MTTRVEASDLRKFVRNILERLGTPHKNAKIVASHLVESDLRSFHQHGVDYLPTLVRQIQDGVVDHKACPEVIRETAASCYLDGKNALGFVVAHKSIKIACKKAMESGISIVVAKNSNYFGNPRCWADVAVIEGMIGIILTNGPSTADEAAVLKEDCIAVAVPCTFDQFDWESIGQTVGMKWLGEILTSVLSGSDTSTEIAINMQKKLPARMGQTFIVINTEMFSQNFEERACNLLGSMKQSTGSSAFADMGEEEKKEKANQLVRGISLKEEIIRKLEVRDNKSSFELGR